MKIDFEDGSYIEIQHSFNPGKLFILIAAKQSNNTLETIINSVELNFEQFKLLFSEFNKDIIDNLNKLTSITPKNKKKTKKKAKKKKKKAVEGDQDKNINQKEDNK